MMISKYDDFEMEKQYGLVLLNILLKNLVKVTSLCILVKSLLLRF